ncbi:hypothetical protein GUJ93_ZPchr0013g36256 [Zizania palustris]|uniref:Uncharacterized protein n=1 Tax=Zizania palustris TaxID=103762 RepID=A0A8J5WYA9_ZIZPA|nr:hypothetical protein GUJ93_ZPchr0013g36256 [Zizania palustris]
MTTSMLSEFASTPLENAKEMDVEHLSNKDPGSNTSISSDVGDDRRRRHRMNDHGIAFLGEKLDSFVAALKDDSSQDPKIADNGPDVGELLFEVCVVKIGGYHGAKPWRTLRREDGDFEAEGYD